MMSIPATLAQAAADLQAAPVDAVTPPYKGIAIGAGLVASILLAIDYRSRTGTISRATTKETLRQPVFLLMLALGALLVIANIWVPYFSLGDDTKMFIDCGLATILIACLITTVWTASLSVADEIEGKTAMTLLSKPVNRWQFVIGKYLGILQAALIMILILGTLFFIATYYKIHYDRREASIQQLPLIYMKSVSLLPFKLPFLNKTYFEGALTILPGLSLIAMEVAVLTSISVAISTRVPMLVNISTCFSIFVIGHLTPVLVLLEVQNVFVRFVASLLATVMPVLEHFNVSAAIATGKIIPGEYLLEASLYCLAYMTAVLLLGLLMFEDRDLA